MIALKITDTRTFMSHLLIKDTFDGLLFTDVELAMANTYSISGSINRGFYTDEEYDVLPDKDYSTWGAVKPFCYSLIKGSKVPGSMKVIFCMPKQHIEEVLEASGGILTADDVEGMNLNVRYMNGELNLITGTSLKTFTLDKSVEKAYDNYIIAYLDRCGIDYTICT